MNRALAFLCPITDGGGTKLKVLDALAMALPVVAHPIACEGIEVTDRENVLFASTTAEYLDHLSMLSDDVSFANAISDSARQLVLKKYSVNAIGKDLRAEYGRLAESHRSAT